MSQESKPESVERPLSGGFVCECEPEFRSVCKGLTYFKEHRGKCYCVLHYPANDKVEPFNAAFQPKLADADFAFAGVWFPAPVNLAGFEFSADADFSFATFGAHADFSHAKFNATSSFVSATFIADAAFSQATFIAVARFGATTFSGVADFNHTRFMAIAYFPFATFCGASGFASATFVADADFSFARFSEVTDFVSARFNASADFHNATFSGVSFGNAKTCGRANFGSATFTAYGNFGSVIFGSDADFSYAKLCGDADFRSATFSAAANFDCANLDAYVTFTGDEGNLVFSRKSSLTLEQARVKNPEHISFHTVLLRPHWFVNVDARKFEFINVNWHVEWSPKPGRMSGRFMASLKTVLSTAGFEGLHGPLGVREEIHALEARQIASPHLLLSIACRNLAVNAEDNNRYEEASTLRYMAMDSARHARARGFGFWRLRWWYWLASGYGERWRLAAGWLLAIVFLIFPLLYTQAAFQPPKATVGASTTLPHPPGGVGANTQQPTPSSPDSVVEPQRLAFGEAVTYSLETVTFQKPDPKPLGFAAHLAISLELTLGPLQAALLALAIRRKFIR
jgi:hypothetical protein